MKNLSTISYETVRKHQTNNSPSKVSHQFSKTSRFKDPNPEYFFDNKRCPMAYYENKSSISNRKTSFGYGNKSDFTKTLTCSPGATKYNLKNVLEESKHKGKSFGCSRNKSEDQSYITTKGKNVPGPGNVLNLLFIV